MPRSEFSGSTNSPRKISSLIYQSKMSDEMSDEKQNLLVIKNS